MLTAEDRYLHYSIQDAAAREIEQFHALDAAGEQARIVRYWNAEKPRRNWCAAFTMYLRERCRLDAPAAGKARRGARACVHWIAEHGEWVVKPKEYVTPVEILRRVLPGDVVCWRRGVLSWTAHVGTVTHIQGDIIHGIEGNVNGSLRPFKLSAVQMQERLKGLYAIARAS